MIKPSILAAMLAAAIAGAPAPGGTFRGALLVTFMADGRTMKLTQPYTFVDGAGLTWDVPTGAVVDGASIPQVAWSLIGGPFEGKYRNASVIHDWFCDVRTRSAEATHRMFFNAMIASGVEIRTAKTMYAAVAAFGPQWGATVVENNRLAAGDRSPPAITTPRNPPLPSVKPSNRNTKPIGRLPVQEGLPLDYKEVEKLYFAEIRKRIATSDLTLDEIDALAEDVQREMVAYELYLFEQRRAARPLR